MEVELIRQPYQLARWVQGDNIDPSHFRINSLLVKDKHDQPVALFENEYALRAAMDKLPDAVFLDTAP